jgi:hypothetical protein
MLATSPVEFKQCGTGYSGYLKDGTSSLPSRLGQEVDATVCFNWSGSNSCFLERKIKIRKCSDFFIYNLPTTPSCTSGYCGE